MPALALCVAVPAVAAQEVRDPLPPQVPASFTPPAGLCRIWLTGVPATQQPAPTDCASAIKNRPTNAAVLFGPNPSKRRSEPGELESLLRQSRGRGVPMFAPNAPAPRPRDETRDRATDTTAKVPRKPEKPQ